MIFAVNARERKAPENMHDKSREEIWRETIQIMEESLAGVPEEDREAYEQRIRQKMQSGKKLSPEEMNYLRVYQPELYRSAVRVENARKILRTKLKNCQSKEEVENVVSIQNEVLKAMKGDPDREYLSAMVQHEVQSFKKSAAYARLPQYIERDRDKHQRKVSVSENQIRRDEEGRNASNQMTVLGQLRLQCDSISQIAERAPA